MLFVFPELFTHGISLLRVGRAEGAVRRMYYAIYPAIPTYPIAAAVGTFVLSESPGLLPYQVTWLARQFANSSEGFTLSSGTRNLLLLADSYLIGMIMLKVLFTATFLFISLLELDTW